MKKLLILLVVSFALTLNGCVSGAVDDVIDAADMKVRLKWQEEWKPALVAEAKLAADAAKEAALNKMTINLEKYRAETTGKLTQIGVKVENFDSDGDGKVSGMETLALVKEIKAKNDNAPKPLEWWEILAAVGAAYLPLTGAKELARKKMSGTGSNGTLV